MNLLVLPKAIVAFCVFLCLCLLGSVETFTTTVSSSPDSLLVAEVFQRYSYLPEGKHINERVSIDVVVKEIKQISPHLVFMRAYDHEDGIIELLLRERDSFLTTDEIERIKFAASQPGSRLHCCGFPESLGAFDGPTFFPDLEARPTEPVCLHLVAANVSLANGKVLEICPQERPQIIDSMPGRMPPVRGGCKSGNRGGGGNRDRGGIFAAWAVERFQLKPGIARILDVAGGSGQLAFQLGVRRGYNVTVVDPRALRLAPDQQRTLHYHRKTRLRLLPGERNPSLPVSDYGHHFCELPVHSLSDRTFLVSGNAQVKHLQTYFDPDFVTTRAWESCSAVLGMHPDEVCSSSHSAIQHVGYHLISFFNNPTIRRTFWQL